MAVLVNTAVAHLSPGSAFYLWLCTVEITGTSIESRKHHVKEPSVAHVEKMLKLYLEFTCNVNRIPHDQQMWLKFD